VLCGQCKARQSVVINKQSKLLTSGTPKSICAAATFWTTRDDINGSESRVVASSLTFVLDRARRLYGSEPSPVFTVEK
jgi:hypothetical protein